MAVKRGRYTYIGRGDTLKRKVASGAATSGFLNSDDLSAPLERTKLKATVGFERFKIGAREVWDDIMISTATERLPPPSDTYGVDTHSGGSIIKFRVWWDNFKGSPESAAARFNRADRLPAFEEWFVEAIEEILAEVHR